MYCFKIKEMDHHGAVKESSRSRDFMMNVNEEDKLTAVHQVMNVLFPFMDLSGNEKLTYFVHPCKAKKEQSDLFKESINVDWEKGEGSIKFWRRPLSDVLRDESFRTPVIHLHFKKAELKNGAFEEKEIGELLWNSEEGLSEIPLNIPYGEVPDILPARNEKMIKLILRNPEILISAYEVCWAAKSDYSEIGKIITVWVR